MTRCLVGACKEVSCFAPLALAVFIGCRMFCNGGSGIYSVPQPQFQCSLTTKFNMADEDVATRAPESDAKEPSMLSSEDTPAQKGASMGVRYTVLHSRNAADLERSGALCDRSTFPYV